MFNGYQRRRFLRLITNSCPDKDVFKYADIISGHKYVAWYDSTLMAALKQAGASYWVQRLSSNAVMGYYS